MLSDCVFAGGLKNKKDRGMVRSPKPRRYFCGLMGRGRVLNVVFEIRKKPNAQGGGGGGGGRAMSGERLAGITVITKTTERKDKLTGEFGNLRRSEEERARWRKGIGKNASFANGQKEQKNLP